MPLYPTVFVGYGIGSRDFYHATNRGLLYLYRTPQRSLERGITNLEILAKLSKNRRFLIGLLLCVWSLLYPLPETVLSERYTAPDGSGDAHIFTTQWTGSHGWLSIQFRLGEGVIAKIEPWR